MTEILHDMSEAGRSTEDAQVPSVERLIDTAVEAAKRGNPQEAFAWIKRAASLYPDRYEPHYFQGCMLANDRQHEGAIVCFQRALDVAPLNVAVIQGLVLSLRRVGRFAEAEAQAQNWSIASPDDCAARATLAHIFMEQYRFDEALPYAQAAAAMAPGNVDAIILIAGILAQLGRTREAIENLIRAREYAPQRPDLLLHLGNILKIEGRFDEARAALHHALRLDPGNTTAFFEIAEITRFSPDHPLLAEMERFAAAEAARSLPASSRLHFALGKAYDDIGQADIAFRHFAVANARERAANRYDERATLAVLARIKDTFSPAFIEGLRGKGDPSLLPIFIVGMPRSGTTLIEQILTSHPDVAAGGELHYFPQSVDAILASRAPGRAFPDTLSSLLPEDLAAIGERYLSCIAPLTSGGSRLTDKLPANALLVGLISMALPNAKIIHCVRDPLDTCLSCFMKSFAQRVPYSTDLGTLGRYYRAQTRLMEHWQGLLPAGRILEVRYEDVVSDLEGQARRLISHCGLDWDSRCLSFHKTKKSVNTASVAQVREPIYNSSIGRWRPYAKHLGPLQSALENSLL